MPPADMITPQRHATDVPPALPAPLPQVDRMTPAPSWLGYASAMAAAIVTTVMAAPLAAHLELVNIVMLFLLAVVR